MIKLKMYLTKNLLSVGRPGGRLLKRCCEVRTACRRVKCCPCSDVFLCRRGKWGSACWRTTTGPHTPRGISAYKAAV